METEVEKGISKGWRMAMGEINGRPRDHLIIQLWSPLPLGSLVCDSINPLWFKYFILAAGSPQIGTRRPSWDLGLISVCQEQGLGASEEG